ncbi:type II toxin-antitoxin system death-on-curing family toxin [Helicobacter sp. T3_23-1059]
MNYLSLEDAIALHDKMIEVMGGLQGFDGSRVGYLESALEHIKNDDFYPSFVDKLTHLIFCCVKFHPFLDGNKRSAILIARVFVLINAPEILPNDFYEKLENVVVGVANDEINKDSLKAILANILSF